MKQNLLLVDGNSILNRAFYGYPQFVNHDGKMLHGVYGFINIINKHRSSIMPTHMAIAFDMAVPTFRHIMYADYKGTRKTAPPGLGDNFEPLQNLLDLMGLKWIGLPGYEGDDVIGTLANRFSSEDMEVVILSGDKDLFQLIRPNITVHFPKTINGKKFTITYDERQFMDEFGINPRQYVDLKALMGDTSDNIPGVKGIGPKTAKKIISAFGSIESAYEHADEIKPQKYGELLTDQFSSATFSKKLATISTCVPLDVDINELKIGEIWTNEALDYLKDLDLLDKIWKL